MRLLPFPYMHHELCLKATLTGVTFIKQNRFRQRYTGSKTARVDLNSKIHLTAKSYREELNKGLPVKPKKKAAQKSSPENSVEMQDKNINNLSTSNGELLTIPPDLSTKQRSKSYSVNKREVRQRLLGYMHTIAGKKELYFWTVTFPAGTSDDKAYQAFNIWLTSLRQKKYLKDYLWIAERQDGKRLKDPGKTATNTLHFHIAIPHKMPIKIANGYMRTTLTGMAKNNEIPFNIYQCKKYNGVDIAKDRKTKRVTNFAIKKGSRALGNYLTKYVTKNDTEFSHLAWHNSRGYSAIFTGITFTIEEFKNYGFAQLLFRAKAFGNEYFTFVPWFNDPPVAITNHLTDLNNFIQSQTQKN